MRYLIVIAASFVVLVASAIEPPKPATPPATATPSQAPPAEAPPAAEPEAKTAGPQAAAEEEEEELPPLPAEHGARRAAAGAFHADRESARGLPGLVPDRHLRIT